MISFLRPVLVTISLLFVLQLMLLLQLLLLNDDDGKDGINDIGKEGV